MPDPAAARTELEADAVIADVARTLAARLRLLASLPVDALDRMSMQARVRAIGHDAADAA
jgi:hypothetical protein